MPRVNRIDGEGCELGQSANPANPETSISVLSNFDVELKQALNSRRFRVLVG